MTCFEFNHAMEALIPEHDSELTDSWASFAGDITDQMKEYLADCAGESGQGKQQSLADWYRPRSVLENNLQEIHASLYNINRQYGAGICRQVYELAKIPFCTYPLESLNIAEYLSQGGNPGEILLQYEKGQFDWDIPDDSSLLIPCDSQVKSEMSLSPAMQ